MDLSSSKSLPTQASPKHDYLVAILCPMGVELAPVEAMFEVTYPSPHFDRDKNVYKLGRIEGHNVVAVVLPKQGNNAAAIATTQLLNDFPHIRFALLVGIGGGVPGDNGVDDVRLGDVVVGQSKRAHGGLVQFDLGKVTATGKFERTGKSSNPPDILLAYLEAFKGRNRQIEMSLSKHVSLAQPQLPGQDQLFLSDYDHRDGATCGDCDPSKLVQRSPRQGLRIHYGTIGSANQVVKDGATREKLKQDLGVLCVEMEGAGMMDAFPCLVIRGICDYADSHKNKDWQPYAAAVAAAYMKELLSSIPTTDIERAPTATDVLDNSNRNAPPDLRQMPISVQQGGSSFSGQNHTWNGKINQIGNFNMRDGNVAF